MATSDITVVREHEAMDDDTFQVAVAAATKDAVHYIDNFVAPYRAEATALYRGDRLGNEEDGRSQIVMTEVRDVIQAMLPDLLRIFCGPEKAVEYLPRTEAKIEEAEQATDYISYIISVENPGFQIFFNAFKDALRAKTGVLKWYVEEKQQIFEEDYSDLTADQVQLLKTMPDVEVLKVESDDDDAGEQVFDVRIRRTPKEQAFRVDCLPPEEFLIARNARDLDTTPYAGHRREIPLADLVALGYDLAELEANMGTADLFSQNLEAETRNPAITPRMAEPPSNDPMMRPVVYTESYIRIDKDGDGIAELRKVCTLGHNHYVLHDEIWDGMIPFALLCPDPEPHMAIGNSVTDQVKDLQRIKTALVRNTLDSLAQSIHPRTAVVEGAVNMDDVLNTEVGGVIRMKAPGMVQPLDQPFVGQNALPIISYMDDIRAQRTGITKASQGLDPDVLQSTTKAAVTATVSAAQMRLEMVARIFAETGMKRLFRGLLQLVVKHQDKEKIVRLRGKFVPVDPRSWDAEMDVIVNVGLGTGSPGERMQMMMQVAAKQEQILATLGPDNPLVGIVELRNSYAKILELAGQRDVSRYFKPVDANTQVQAPSQGGGGANDPTAALAQVEMQKAQNQLLIEQAKLQQKAASDAAADDRERDKMMMDGWLRMQELNLKYGAQMQLGQLQMIADDVKSQREQMMTAMQPPAQPPQGGPPDV